MASDEAGHVAWQQLQRCYFVFVYYFYTIHLKTHISHTLPAVPPPLPMLLQSSSQQGVKIPGTGEENSIWERGSAIGLFPAAQHEPHVHEDVSQRFGVEVLQLCRRYCRIRHMSLMKKQKNKSKYGWDSHQLCEIIEMWVPQLGAIKLYRLATFSVVNNMIRPFHHGTHNTALNQGYS